MPLRLKIPRSPWPAIGWGSWNCETGKAVEWVE